MSPRDLEKRELIERVTALTEESYRLPRNPEGFKRREAIEWELVQLFRQIANLSAGPTPYWFDEEAHRSGGTKAVREYEADRGRTMAEVDDLRAFINQLAALTRPDSGEE